MGFLKRLMVLFSVTFVAFISVCFILFSLQIVEVDLLGKTFNLFYGIEELKWGLVGFSIVMLLVNYFVFKFCFFKVQPDKIIAFDNPSGRVTVALTAIEEMIKKLLSNVQEIRDTKTKIIASRKGLNIETKLSVVADTNIPGLTSRVQNTILKKVQDTIGLEENIEVKISVNKILSPVSNGEPIQDDESETSDKPKTVPYHGFRG